MKKKMIPSLLLALSIGLYALGSQVVYLILGLLGSHLGTRAGQFKAAEWGVAFAICCAVVAALAVLCPAIYWRNNSRWHGYSMVTGLIIGIALMTSGEYIIEIIISNDSRSGSWLMAAGIGNFMGMYFGLCSISFSVAGGIGLLRMQFIHKWRKALGDGGLVEKGAST